MSEKYLQQITDLTAWFVGRFANLPPLAMTDGDIALGCDAVKDEAYRRIIAESFGEWLNERSYELSYSQTCSAFFAALTESNKLQKVG